MNEAPVMIRTSSSEVPRVQHLGTSTCEVPRAGAPRNRSKVLVVFAGTAAGLVGLWMLLGLLYGGVAGRASAAEVREVVAGLSSTTASVEGTTATGIVGSLRYFDITGHDAGALGVDPAVDLVLMVSVDTHVGDLPDPSAWTRGAFVRAADGRTVTLGAAPATAYRSDHHQTVALSFPPRTAGGTPVLADDGSLDLVLPNVSGSESAVLTWELPLDGSSSNPLGALGGAATLGGALAVMAGLLVVFSPCAIHLTTVFLPIITGLGIGEIQARSSDRRFRVHVAALAVAFVSGFVVLYTSFGVAAGFAGSFFSDTTALRPYLVPVRIVTGGIVVYLALQTLGLFRMPFMLSLQLPGQPHLRRPRQGHMAAAVAGASVSVGCLACVGGTLLTSLLLFAGTSGSPLTGGATLFLFSAGVSVPFVVVAVALGRVLPALSARTNLLKYSGAVSAAVMLVVGLLIISGGESVFEQLAPGLDGTG